MFDLLCSQNFIAGFFYFCGENKHEKKESATEVIDVGSQTVEIVFGKKDMMNTTPEWHLTVSEVDSDQNSAGLLPNITCESVKQEDTMDSIVPIVKSCGGGGGLEDEYGNIAPTCPATECVPFVREETNEGNSESGKISNVDGDGKNWDD